MKSVKLNEVDFKHYAQLHPEGRKLIQGWFRRAWEKRDCSPSDSFEPFIFCWIAFNGWGACISGHDDDKKWNAALSLNEQMNTDFQGLVAQEGSDLSKAGMKFKSLWPILKAQEIRKLGDPRISIGGREEIVSGYLERGVKTFAPACGEMHKEKGEEIPLDWPHMLAALYRVRCNLFHGEKAAHSEMDKHVVSTAFHVLVHFLAEAEYILADMEEID